MDTLLPRSIVFFKSSRTISVMLSNIFIYRSFLLRILKRTILFSRADLSGIVHFASVCQLLQCNYNRMCKECKPRPERPDPAYLTRNHCAGIIRLIRQGRIFSPARAQPARHFIGKSGAPVFPLHRPAHKTTNYVKETEDTPLWH